MRMMTPEERIAEFGTVEEKRRYIAEKRLEDPNWKNTIFPPGKAARDEPWAAPHKGVYKAYMSGGHPPVSVSLRYGARPERGRKARRH